MIIKKSIYWKRRATLGVSCKVRNDYADYDYLHKLNKTELEFLKAFHREYINADFKHKYIKIYTFIKDKRIIYNLNNNKNRDLYNIKKVQQLLVFSDLMQSDISYFASNWIVNL